MALKLSSWLVLVRVLQLMGALAAAGLNGYLTASIYMGKLGLSQNMVILELLICILLVYTTLSIIAQNTGERSKKKGWLICFVVLDVCFCGLALAIISLLSQAGVPSYCKGLTRSDYDDDDAPNQPRYGFTTIRFSDESEGQHGHLDKYCGFERSYFFIAIALVFTYIATVVLGMLAVYETNHTRNDRLNETLDSLERARNNDMDLKLLESSSSPLMQAPRVSIPARPSEGIITRSASLRSNITSVTTSTTSNAPNPYRGGQQNLIPRRPLNPQPPLPRRPSLPGKQPSSPKQNVHFTPIPLDEDSADAALVSDGMHHHHPHQMHPILENDDDSAAMVVADGMQHRPQRQQPGPSPHHHPPQQQQQQQQQQQIMLPMLLEEEQSAETALTSDGMRPSEPMLPPYEPSRSRMSGHGGDDELALSGYVKGGARA
ncbi:hypothetical protein B0T25DRAFT_570499 [Lasiosphaeria hispida]|uniref:MARVEL domain-containing protein n=1 Tax=Lasiosphaeria hispida TaxID=260671 RepID=A0AAJ0MD44_9PEZI|nr:hypothetical protein B0T25DRAFT_570499 [Lasiosphaeria hispida]